MTIARGPSGRPGFTIVELLIVIVVIAILAAITIVAYNGVQTRANNSLTEDVAEKYRKALILYATDNGAYPAASSFCLGTYPSGCWNGSVNATALVALKPYMNNQIATPLTGCHMMYSGCRVGIAFSTQNINLDGSNYYWSISYMLDGDVKCTADGQAGGTWTNAVSTPNAAGRIEYNSGTALCRLLLPDPTKL